MTMHEHNSDLIMAVAEERLTDDRRVAVAEIASCQECSKDLELQRTALAALEQAPRAYLTAIESARLRDAVRSELKLASLDPVSAAPLRRRRFPLGVLAGAAAVLLAVVIAAPALNLLGSSSPADGDPQTVAPALEVDDVSGAAASPAPRALSQAPAQIAPSPNTSAAAGEIEAADASAADLVLAATGLPILRDELDLASLLSQLVNRGEKTISEVLTDADALAYRATAQLPANPALSDNLTLDPGISCDPESVVNFGTDVTATIVGIVEFEEHPALVVLYEGVTPDAATLAVLDIETCELAASG